MKRYLAFFLLAAACSSPPPPSAKPPVAVTVERAELCDIPVFRDYIGHVVPYRTVQVVPQVQGYLHELSFQQGQEVRAGDLLATIDTRVYEAALAQAEAQLAQTVAELRHSEETVGRYAKLVKNDFVSQLDFDQYITDVLSNEAIIKQNLAQIETAKLNLSYCYMKAPMDAIAGRFLVDPGNFLSSGGDNPVVVLNQIQPIYIQFTVPEGDLPRLQRLQMTKPILAHATVEGVSDRTYEGNVSFIDNQINSLTGSIVLEATLPNEDKTLWPGQFVSVRILVEQLQNVIAIPEQAIQVGQDGNYVLVVQEDTQKTVARPVQVGEKSNHRVLIQSGLKAGELFVTKGQLNLIPGVSTISIQHQGPLNSSQRKSGL